MCIHDHEQSNAAFLGTHADEDWIELYHSRPSWKVCQISFRKDGGEWVPFGSYKLIDASDVRPGFRVFRTRAHSLEFRLASGHTAVIDSNNGRNYHVESPGRYVVEGGSGCRRVSDAQIADCLRSFRPNDHYVELQFEPNTSWRNCFVTFARTGESSDAWYKLPMLRDWDGRVWHQRLDSATGIVCAFHDGNDGWDSNVNKNYNIPLPGRYLVRRNQVTYLGVAEADSSAT